MRCNSCEKFVSYDTEVDPEENEEPTIEGLTFTASYRRVLTCADCGDELKGATIDFSVDLDTFKMPVGDDGEEQDATDEEIENCGGVADAVHEWEMDVTATPTTETVTKDRHGKPIKSHRYMKTLYGVQVEGTAKCSKCGLVAVIDDTDSVQASGMDEL